MVVNNLKVPENCLHATDKTTIRSHILAKHVLITYSFVDNLPLTYI